MPSSAYPPWQTDKPARPAGERNDQPRSYTTSGDTILTVREIRAFGAASEAFSNTVVTLALPSRGKMAL